MEPMFDIYNPKERPPTSAWFWSTANHCWRLPPAPFRWDRFGLHVPMGIALAAVGCALTHIGEPALGVAAYAVGTWVFVRYEVTESAHILDIPYPDLAGELTGALLTFGAYAGLRMFGVL